MYKRHWICLAGPKGAGKDSFGDIFVDNGYTKVNFADNLKHMCAYSFEKEECFFFDPKLKDKNFKEHITINKQHIKKMNEWIAKTHQFTIPDDFIGKVLISPRNLMQFVGTDIIRVVHHPYHVEATIPEMKKHNKMICCDVRFENELIAITEASKKKRIKLHRVFIKRPGFGGDDTHTSENSIKEDMMGVTIMNDTTLDNLKYLAKLFLGED